MATCPTCGFECDSSFKFCPECGGRLASLPAEERRTVTVMFCDLVGFTGRAETLDPEDVRAFLVPYYDLLEEEAERHGGVIDKLYGDGALIVFGAPVAHEDDPERAVGAALRIVERLPGLGLGLDVRVGINTGEVLRAASSIERGDALTGDTVNTASRIESLAAPGTVAVSYSTFRAAEHAFAFESLDPVVVKGKTDPVPIFRPLHAVSRRRPEPLEHAPFVGRREELARLLEAFDDAGTAGPRFVSIVAEPGYGKSRLVRELSACVSGGPAPVAWYEGRCLPYGEGIAYWALSEILKGHAGIQDTDDAEAITRKLHHVLREPDPSTKTWMVERLAPLVGLPARGETPERQELFTAWGRFVAELAADGPVVLVVEDLHWADEGLVAFLESLRGSLVGVPILVVTTARPELADRHAAWLEQTDTVRLTVLDDESMRVLVGTMLEDASLELVGRVIDRAQGSPLYARQFAAMCQSLETADGLPDELPIPESIQALLAARIDRLSDEQRRVLVDASVIGRGFWAGAVAALGGTGVDGTLGILRELVDRSMVQPVAASAIEDDAEFSFVHALLRDAAYGLLSRRSRLTKHERAASWIADRVGRPLGEIADIVVDHLERAREAARTAGLPEDRRRIESALVDALADAGAHACTNDLALAASRLQQAAALVPADDPRRLGILLAAAEAATHSGRHEVGQELALEAVDLCRALGDHDGLGQAISIQAVGLAATGEEVRGQAVLRAARAELAGFPGQGLINVLSALAEYESQYGDQQGALDQIAAIERMASELRLDVPAFIPGAKGGAMVGLGNLDGLRLCRQQIADALDAGDATEAVVGMNNLAAYVAPFEGYRAAADILDAAISLATSRGVDPGFAPAIRLQYLFELGQWDEIVHDYERLRSSSAWDPANALVIDCGKAFARVCVDRGGSWLARIDPHVVAPEEATWPRDRDVRAGLAILADCAAGRRPDRLRFEHVLLQDPGPVSPSALLLTALLRAGWPDLAAAQFARWPERVPALDNQFEWAVALLAAGRPDPSAPGSWRRLCERARRSGSPREEADALARLGRSLLELDRSEEALEALARSRSLWMAMAADARIAEIDALVASVRAPLATGQGTGTAVADALAE